LRCSSESPSWHFFSTGWHYSDCGGTRPPPVKPCRAQIRGESIKLFDATTEPGRRAEKRLREEKVALLATVRDDRSPQPVLVWFLWDKNAVVHGGGFRG
jgi:hypothetical protein